MDIGLGARHNGVAHFQTFRLQNVAFVAIGVVYKSNTSATVGVILDRDHFAGNPSFVTFKINLPVGPLMPTTLMTNNQKTKIVAARFLAQTTGETFLRLFFRELRKIFYSDKASRRCIGFKGFHFASSPARISCPGLSATIAFFQSAR